MTRPQLDHRRSSAAPRLGKGPGRAQAQRPPAPPSSPAMAVPEPRQPGWQDPCDSPGHAWGRCRVALLTHGLWLWAARSCASLAARRRRGAKGRPSTPRDRARGRKAAR
eukprot:3040895-Alexandrium_andersonii.AAC.1